MAEIMTRFLETILNSAFTLTFVFFVLPRRKMKWWQTTGAVCLMLLGYYLMADAYKTGNLLVGASFECVLFLAPVILISEGDPWRNVVIRMVFQIIRRTAVTRIPACCKRISS